MTALEFPKLVEFLPVLLPRHFRHIISSGSKEVLKMIDEILGTQPWKLGFRKVSEVLVQHLVILNKVRYLKFGNV